MDEPAHFKNMPRMLKLGPFDFTVELMSARDSQARAKYGEFSSMELTIRIDPLMPPVKAVDTLLHELVHAIWWLFVIKDDDKEERIASTECSAWTMFYRDNPKLLAWMQEMLHGN